MKARILVMSMMALGIATVSTAQVQLNASGSYLQTTGNDNNRGIWGGGLGMKFFMGNHFAVGADLHSFPKKTSEFTVGSYNYTTADVVTNAAATFDFLLNSKTAKVQPYIGADAGATWACQTVSFKSESNSGFEQKNTNTYFLLAPKIGLNLAVTPAIGVFGQAKYNFNFGDGENVAINDVPNPFTTEPVKEYLNFDVGIYFRLQGAK